MSLGLSLAHLNLLLICDYGRNVVQVFLLIGLDNF